jgi:hypothetical protein
MGTWGPGNFQNDGALDYLGDLCEQLTATIDKVLADGAAAADEEGESTLVPAVAVLTLLAERLNGVPPKPEKVAGWRTAYLAAFDATMPGLDPKGTFIGERRPVVEQTFANLEAQARDFWKDA